MHFWCFLHVVDHHRFKSVGQNSLGIKDSLLNMRQFLATKIHLKLMKSAFYFNFKTFFVLKISKFFSWLFAIRILLNISRRKGNQTMKFGQLIEYNMRNTFLEKSYIKCGWETIQKLFFFFFFKFKIEHISVLTSLFSLYAEDYWNLLKLTCKSFALTSNKTFLKNKMMSGASLPASFSTLFLKENIYLLYCVTDQISLSGCLCLMRYWAICVLKLFVNQVVKLGILKLTLSF